MDNKYEESLKKALLLIKQQESTIDSLEHEPIAVIGMSCRFPGGANSPKEFWNLLKAGFDSSIEVPASRWNIDEYYDLAPDAPGKIVSRKSCFLNIDIKGFDTNFFEISPRETEYLDPQQRLLLEVTWEALENAGIKPSTLKLSNTGVFIGISGHDYGDSLLRNLHDDEIEAYFATGNASSTAAGRISYLFGLQGPCFPIDTACSSSLVALHQACLSLRYKESDVAISGGVNLLLSPHLSIDFSQAHMLAPDGHCKTFDASADGYVRGDGCGILILKRLSDALKNNDQILTLIKGSAVNQDGPSSGLTVPNGPAQIKLIKQALGRAKLQPNDIDYIEAHGTGTSLGDPIEFNALNQVFSGKRTNPLVVGTVKTNIGHTESAAGIAGVIKTILALQNEEIPRHLHFSKINPEIELDKIPAKIPLDAIDWNRNTTRPRRAGVSSFGFSGTNSHVILEESPITVDDIPIEIQTLLTHRDHFLFISAKNKESLNLQIEQYKKFLSETSASIANICYTSQEGRELFDHLAIFKGTTVDELKTKLEKHEFCTQQEVMPYSPECFIYLRKVTLPNYAFVRQTYWHSALSHRKETKWGQEIHPLLGTLLPRLLGYKERQYIQSLTVAMNPYLVDHQVFNQIIFPAAGYIELMLATLDSINIELNEISIELPLKLEENEAVNLQVIVTPISDTEQTIAIYSQQMENTFQLHAQGIGVINQNLQSIEKNLLSEISDKEYQSYPPENIYSKLSQQGFQYGPKFQVLKSLQVNETEVLAEIDSNDVIDSRYKIYPPLLDGCFQALSGLLMFNKDTSFENTVYLPIGLKNFQLNLNKNLTPHWFVHAVLDTANTDIVKGVLVSDITLLNEKER